LKLKASFHYLARRELNEAAGYYEQECAGLGDAFLDEVEEAIAYVMDHPEGAPCVDGPVRRKLVRRFPYGILYSLRPDSIRILAIMNQRRRPFYWRGRK